MASILKTDEIQSQNGGAVVKMQTLKHPSASGNNITLDSSNNVSLGGTLSAGTIGSGVAVQSGFGVTDITSEFTLQSGWSFDSNNINQAIKAYHFNGFVFISIFKFILN